MPLLKVEKLTKNFPGHPLVLKDVSFDVEKGAIFGIIGSSGAGKSTLLRCIAGLEQPTAGHVFFEEGTVASMIFQQFHLFSSRTALENVLFPLEVAGAGNAKKRGRELLALVGLEAKADVYPAFLSGGEKQRVAIARALAMNPTLLFSDEATSSLDPPTTRQILDLLLKLNRELGLTIVLITHQMEVIKQICTQMAVLHEGKIVERGSVSSLFASPQHAVTRSLVHPPGLQRQDLFHLTFQGKAASLPLISRMLRQFDVEANILWGNIEQLQEGLLGRLTVELTGSQIREATAFLEAEGVIVGRGPCSSF